MRYINSLTDDERAALQREFRESSKAYFRSRCHSILLSDQGHRVPEIARVLAVRTRTIYTWFDRYETSGLNGLRQKSGQGIKARLDSLTESQIEQIRELLTDNPRQLTTVCEKAGHLLGFRVTKNMLKRFIKKNCITHGDGSENA